MRYFARSKFFGSLVHKRTFWLDMTSSFQVRMLVSSRIPLLSLNELRTKSQATIVLGKFVNKP